MIFKILSLILFLQRWGHHNKSYSWISVFNKHKAIYKGLGGSFDLYTGGAKQVPKFWLKYIKWEGLYRLFNDITNVKRIERQKIIFKYFSYIINGKL